MTTYWIRRDISGQPPLRVDHEGPPPCLWCGEPVLSPSMDGPLVCGLCDMGRLGEHWMNYSARKQHLRYCIDHIIATQPEGRYPKYAGPEWFNLFKLNGVPVARLVLKDGELVEKPLEDS